MHCDESAQTLKYTTKYSNQYIIIFHGALALCLALSISLSLSLRLTLHCRCSYNSVLLLCRCKCVLHPVIRRTRVFCSVVWHLQDHGNLARSLAPTSAALQADPTPHKACGRGGSGPEARRTTAAARPLQPANPPAPRSAPTSAVLVTATPPHKAWGRGCSGDPHCATSHGHTTMAGAARRALCQALDAAHDCMEKHGNTSAMCSKMPLVISITHASQSE